MELRHLRYFRMVAAERNFTRAAVKLNIAQPPLSRQIQQLEAEFGAQLFVRGARPLELTEAGRLLCEHAGQVLERIEDIRAGVGAVGGRRRIDYPIGFVGSILCGALPSALRALRKTRPDLAVRLIEMTTLEQLQGLRERRIAVGFGRLRFEDPQIEQRVLRQEPLVACLPCEDALAAATGPLPLAALMGETLVVYPRKPRPSYADQVLALLRERDLTPAGVIEAGELQTVLGLVASGFGFCLAPEPASRLRDDIVVRAIPDEGVTSPVIVSTRAGDRDEATAALLGTLAQIMLTDAVRPA